MSNNLRPDFTPSVDFTIHQLSELRSAILTCLDDGDVKSGRMDRRWMLYDDDEDVANEQRLDFCDEVAGIIIKRIKEAQKANEIIDHKATAF